MKFVFVLLLPLLISAQTAESLYFKNACNSCHGIYGQGMGATPKIQGLKETLLLKRLKDLQQGKTRTPNGFIMISFAQSLDANQTRQMAKYLSTLKTKIDDNRYELEYDRSGDGGS